MCSLEKAKSNNQNITKETDAKESHIDDDSSIWTKQDSLLYTFLDATDNLVAVFDVKSGIRATTVVACLSAVKACILLLKD